MPMDESVKQSWQQLQAQYDYPIDALGRPIDAGDQETLAIWQSEGIDKFVNG